jgi:hypothetical protein
MQTYPLRDALVDVLDRYDRASADEVTDALLSILCAHVVSEGLDPVRFVQRVRVSIAALASTAESS